MATSKQASEQASNVWEESAGRRCMSGKESISKRREHSLCGYWMVLCIQAYEVDVGPLDRTGMIRVLFLRGYKRVRRAMCGTRAWGGDACLEKNHQQNASTLTLRLMDDTVSHGA